MCRLSYTLLAGALMVLAMLLNESSCFTLHRFDNINNERRDDSADANPATATGSGDEPSSQHQLFKRSAAALPAQQPQLTAAEWQLLLQQMIGQHNVDSSDEWSLRPAATNVGGDRRQQLDWDASDELEQDDDDSWKNVDLLKKLFGNSWESVKDMQFAHTSTEDLIEDWIRNTQLQTLAWGERHQHPSSSNSGSAATL
ncbi:uncharacterized protein LOC124207737 [Daphnia pulex]|uniref:uncharacterized protein LOC124207737 n=1 Tax=Daphnia pulex TaxID=6669 RepID=UPI001EDF485F|nr:uncharacterized protein LOC124207737 [Daphnia pulex]